MNDDAKRWLAHAYIDLRSAKALIEEEIYSQACFHCQQCVEKSLKSILAYQGKTIPRTHSIAALTTLLVSTWSFSTASELTVFDIFYMLTRYPDAFPGALPDSLSDKSDADNAFDHCA